MTSERSISHTTDDAFSKDVLESGKPVLVDFWAEWCQPCKRMLPILEKVAQNMGETLQVIKVNIDENPMTPTQYGVRSIPTLIIFKDGQAEAVLTGAMPESKIMAWLGETL